MFQVRKALPSLLRGDLHTKRHARRAFRLQSRRYTVPPCECSSCPPVPNLCGGMGTAVTPRQGSPQPHRAGRDWYFV